MKRLISALLILTMLVSMACVSTSAAVVLNADFSSWTNDQFYSQFMNGLFSVEDGLLVGYSDAKALQSMYDDQTDNNAFDNQLNTWLTYDATITFSMMDDDVVDWERFVTLAYCNDNLKVKGAEEGRSFITFSYHIEKQQFDVCVSGSPTYDAETTIVDSVPMELDGDGGEFYTLGMSVDRNRIRFFCDDQLIYDIDATQYAVAESINSPFFFWNNGNFLQISNITVATVGHLFPYASDDNGVTETEATQDNGANTEATEATTTATENNNNNNGGQAANTTANVTSETTTAVVTSVVTNEQGETSIVTSIVTEATTTPGAETNKKPAKPGNATTTGDATFVVIAAMVAALGCAVVVKKANER